MLSKISPGILAANAVALVALIVALGGPGYAADAVSSIVPKARSADKVDGFHASATPKPRTLVALDRYGKLPASVVSTIAGPAGPQGLKGDTGAQGPKGDPGPQGPPGRNGTDATVNGIAAGGDLTGTYPNPSIAAGAIGPSKFATLPAVSATTSTAQSIPNITATALAFDSEDFDTAGMHGTAAAENTRLYPPIAGTYVVTAFTQWQINASGVRQLNLKVGGTSVALDSRPGSASGISSSVSAIVRLVPGQFVSAEAWQNSGGALNANSYAFGRLSMAWVGP